MHAGIQGLRLVLGHSVARCLDRVQKLLDRNSVLPRHIKRRNIGEMLIRERDLRDAALAVLLDGKNVVLHTERDFAVLYGIKNHLQALDGNDHALVKKLRNKACFVGREFIGNAQICGDRREVILVKQYTLGISAAGTFFHRDRPLKKLESVLHLFC